MDHEHHDFASVVMVVAPMGIPLVSDISKPEPIYWKLPGGKSKAGESAVECAVRELRKETGIKVSSVELRLIFQEQRRDHIFTVFRVDLYGNPEWVKIGEEDEGVNWFTPREILAMNGFLSSHRSIIQKALEELARRE